MSPFRRRKPVPQPVEVEQEQPDLLRSEGYEPLFPRLSTHRRVLGHVTPEVDRDHLGPRNTVPALEHALIADDHTHLFYPEQLPPVLEDLVRAGLLDESDGVYRVTDRGWRELKN